MRVLITGGGTGGHIYPALAIARGLMDRYPDTGILYVGTARGMEAQLIPEQGLDFKTVSARGLVRRFSWRGVQSLAATSLGILQALRIVQNFKPQIVIGTGGYVCAPVVLAAYLLRVPVVLHEQNAFPGITNRMLSRIARKVMLTFPDARRFFPRGTDIVHTGLPVRPEILAGDRSQGAAELGLSDKTFHLLVVGGSQGARSINNAMAEVWKYFCGRDDIEILHITGQKGYEETKELFRQLLDKHNYPSCATGDAYKIANITLRPYLKQMASGLAAADLVIGRAGASFLAEVMVRGLPAILIPYPHAAENHQEFNARSLSSAGAAVMILDKELTGAVLLAQLQQLVSSSHQLQQMAVNSRRAGNPQALDKILTVIAEVVG